LGLHQRKKLLTAKGAINVVKMYSTEWEKTTENHNSDGGLHPKKKPGMVLYTVIPALQKLRQEDLEFEASLGYRGNPVSKQTNKKAGWYWWLTTIILAI
jgi:hypothetical protein